jgi:DNA-binding HxlR family transcriptional regulator
VSDTEAGGQRAGSRALSVFANPLNAHVLRAHIGGPQRLYGVQAAVGSSAESTVRAAISNLCEIGALERSNDGSSSRAVATSLSPAGHDLLFLADELEVWLTRASPGPIESGSEEAKGAIKALAGGWSSTLIRELAGRPVTLAELDEAIPEVSYPMLERRINWMRMTGQIEPVQREGRGTPYVVTDWLRHAIAPLCVSGRCERRHLSEGTSPITEVEIEAAFLMAIPLSRLSPHTSGTCVLAAQTDPSQGEQPAALAGVTVEVRHGEVVFCGPSLASAPPTWTVGSPDAWLDAVIDGEILDLRIGGEKPQLGLDLAIGLHAALFLDR